MRSTPRRDSSPLDEAFGPYRLLAFRVLARAFLDLTNPAGSATDRESARIFLAGSGMLSHWCHVAALDPSYIVHQAERLAAGLASRPSTSVAGDPATNPVQRRTLVH